MAMTSILFVCSGNVFRSMTAEYALRELLPAEGLISVSSAGIEARHFKVRPEVSSYLLSRGYDVSGHVPRRITKELIEQSTFTVAMSLNHRDYIRTNYGIAVPLFNGFCFDRDEALLDVDEMYTDWEQKEDQSRRYIRSVIDYLIDSMPRFYHRLQQKLIG